MKDKTIFSKGVTPDQLKDVTTRIDYLFVGMIIVFVLALITFLFTIFTLWIESERFKAETYQHLIDQVYQQNNKIDQLLRKK